MNNLFRFICFGLIFPGESECHIHKTRNTEKTIEICKTTEVKEWNIEIWQSSHTRSDVNQPLSMNRSNFFSHFFNKVFKVWLKGGIERTRREEKWMKGYQFAGLTSDVSHKYLMKPIAETSRNTNSKYVDILCIVLKTQTCIFLGIQTKFK